MSTVGLLVPLLLLWVGCFRATEVPEDPSAEFWVRMYHQLRMAGSDDNIIFSPVSAALALGMVELGARGSSLQQIRQALGYTHYREGEEFAVLKNLTEALIRDEAQCVVHLANSLYLQTSAHFSPEYLKLIKHYFHAEAETVDFNESAAVAQHINAWVQNHTANQILDLVSADDFSSKTRIALINALYFRGSWKNPFRPENTSTFSFIKDDGSVVQTPMMYQQGDFYYEESHFSFHLLKVSSAMGAQRQEECIVLEMPYEGEDMSMMIVLPRQKVPLASLEPIFKASLIDDWAGNVKKQKVEVRLPKFRVEQKINLKETLQQLGISNIFCTNADLSGMNDGAEGLYVDTAVQKSYLEVTEEGAEGAAASAMIVSTKTKQLNHQVMADHPFFFVIRNRKTGSILFMGRVMNPEVVDPFDAKFDSV